MVIQLKKVGKAKVLINLEIITTTVAPVVHFKMIVEEVVVWFLKSISAIKKKENTMKIRTDFITNSSSSAFVVIGVKLSENTTDYYEMYEMLEEKGLRFFGEEGVIGKVIARLDWDSYNSTSKSFTSLETIFVEVEDVLRELGINEEVYLIADMFST
jgi:hypothetical protein